MIDLNQLPLLLGKKHMMDLGLSEFQYYQALKDLTLAVRVGKKTFISKQKLIDQLCQMNEDKNNESSKNE